MVSLTDIHQSSLSHKEDPYAAIILKQCRETHCHFCFNDLPEDTVPCASCSIPSYCSLQCQVKAGGWDFSSMKRYGCPENLPDNLDDHARHVISLNIFGSSDGLGAEHRHECYGVHWPAVLPSDIVLAGRIIVKYLRQQGHCIVDNIHGILDLCHNYGQLPPESKLELHLYSIVLSCCLEHVRELKFPTSAVIVSQIIILVSQIRINSMAVTRMKISDLKGPKDQGITSSVEQVRVGQAVYAVGSLFNHSCEPNVHAYFLSRTLYIRATEFLATGQQLELSYGPQVGQLTCKDRQQLLEDRYSFFCRCSGCAYLNFSDLVINSYRCIGTNCSGVVLDCCVAKYEKQKLSNLYGTLITPRNREQKMDTLNDDINKVAYRLFEQTSNNEELLPGNCWSCGSHLDIQASQAAVVKAEKCINRLQEAIASSEVSTTALLDALKSIDILKMHLHPYNKRIAEVEDNVAQAFSLVGELQAALDHCQASVQILKKLYDPNHIVIGHELIKLISIQLSMGQDTATDNISRLVAIFSQYYGSHVEIIFPHLHHLKESYRLL